MALVEEPIIGPIPELGASMNSQGLVTLGIYAIGAFILYKVAGALAKKSGLT